MEYPEHEKLKAIVAQSQACGEFLDWLQSKGLFLCSSHIHTDACYTHGERWRNCGATDGEMTRARRSTRDLLAEFFEIDENRIDDEKRAMLDKLRAAHA